MTRYRSKIRRRWWLGLGLLLLGMCLTGCQQRVTVATPAQAPRGFVASANGATTTDRRRAQQVAHFVQTKLVTKQGVRTNYLDSKKRTGAVATGHELLSESSGMWLQYLAATHQWGAFRDFYSATKRTFDDRGQFSYRYDPRTKKKAAVNATLDDLRIIRALLAYDEAHGTRYYRKEATNRYQTLVNTSLKDGQLVDYYDMHSRKAAKTASLAYFDLKTLRYFERDTKTGRQQYRRQVKAVQGGYLGDAFPLYAASYQWTTAAYSDKDLNTSEALETLLHLAEVGKLKATSRNWLIQRVRNRDLQNGYTTLGVVSVRGESAANYALAAMIFATLGESNHYQQALRAAWRAQITDASSPLVGALGNAKTQKVYAYNNLTVLNAVLN